MITLRAHRYCKWTAIVVTGQQLRDRIREVVPGLPAEAVAGTLVNVDAIELARQRPLALGIHVLVGRDETPNDALGMYAQVRKVRWREG